MLLGRTRNSTNVSRVSAGAQFTAFFAHWLRVLGDRTTRAEKRGGNPHTILLLLAHEHTRGLEGQPPVYYRHEVVTGDGDVDTFLQAGDHCD